MARITAARDDFESQVKSLAASAEHHTDEVTSLRSTAEDLSRQVRALLRQIAIRDDPSLANVEMNGSHDVDGDIITDQLLEFKSLRGLQEQNQKLLKLTRGLMARLDAREIGRATSDEDDAETGATLDQATETIKKLHAQLLEAQKKIGEANRERDFFSKLLAKGEGLKWPAQVSEGGPLEERGDGLHESTIAGLKEEIEGIRVKAELEISEAREKARREAEEKGAAEVHKARAEAKVGLLEGESQGFCVASGAQTELETRANEDAQRDEPITEAGTEQSRGAIKAASGKHCAGQ